MNQDIPYRLRCCFAGPDGFCTYWESVVKCVGCKFANHPIRARDEQEEIIKTRKKRFQFTQTIIAPNTDSISELPEE